MELEEGTIVFVSDSSYSHIAKRNVLVHTKTCSGKADGEPIAAVLNGADFKSVKSLKAALRKILQEVHTDEHDDCVIEAVYYVCKGKRNLPLVSIVNETGIKQALEEYPESQKNGHRSTALLRLACDWHKKGFAMPTRFSPRRQTNSGSPRNALSSSPGLMQPKDIPSHRIRIEVHAGVNLTKNVADGPIHTIHNVKSTENLSTIKKLVREKVPSACFRAGLYWLPPKQTKPLHTLLTENDLEMAKDTYRDDITGMVKILRLATVIQCDGERSQGAKRSLTSSISSKVSSKRPHDIVDEESDEDAKEFDEEAYSKFQKTASLNSSKSSLKDNNASWNKIHVELRKKLEETGQLSRFGIKHLTVWTDLIQTGEVSGSNEEPDWSKYKHIVDVEPIKRNASNKAMAMTRNMGQGSGISDLLTTMILQQELRREEERSEAAKQRHLEEMKRLEYERKQEIDRKAERNQQNLFQAMMLQALSPQASPQNISVASTSVAVNSNERLITKTTSDVCEILDTMNLGQYANIFLEKGIDGSTLTYITKDGLKELGILSPLDRSKILGYVARERAE